LALQGFRARKGCGGLGDLGPEQIDLVERGGKVGGVARYRGLGTGIARLRLLRVLQAAVAGSGKIGVALVLLGGESHRRLVDLDGSFGGVDHSLLNDELGLFAADRGIGRSYVGFGLIERYPVVAVVDPRQHLPGLDALIVLRQHLLEIAGDLRRDGGAVGLHVGVISGDQILPDGPIVPAIPARGRQHGDRCPRQ
jgi:hypothetical protein